MEVGEVGREIFGLGNRMGLWVESGYYLETCTLCILHVCYHPSHHALEHEATAESSVIQEQLEVTEALLAEKERELTEAREKITSLSEELVVSERSVSTRHEHIWCCNISTGMVFLAYCINYWIETPKFMLDVSNALPRLFPSFCCAQKSLGGAYMYM